MTVLISPCLVSQTAKALEELSLNTPNERVKIELINFDDVKSKKPVVVEEKKQEDAEDIDGN